MSQLPVGVIQFPGTCFDWMDDWVTPVARPGEQTPARGPSRWSAHFVSGLPSFLLCHLSQPSDRHWPVGACCRRHAGQRPRQQQRSVSTKPRLLETRASMGAERRGAQSQSHTPALLRCFCRRRPSCLVDADPRHSSDSSDRAIEPSSQASSLRPYESIRVLHVATNTHCKA